MIKTSRTTKCLICLGFMLLVSVVGINIYQKITNTPKKLFIDAINSLANDYKNFNKIETIDYNFFDRDFNYDGKIDVNIDSLLFNFFKGSQASDDIRKYIDAFNDLELSYKFQRDGSDVLLSINNKLHDDNINLAYYYFGNNHYIKLDNYSEDYININSLINTFKDKIPYIEDKDYLINFIIKDFINNLKNDYFKSIKDTIDIKGKMVSVNKNILILDRKNMTTILNQMLLDLKSDEKTYNMLIKILPNFSDFKIEIFENKDNDVIFYFNTYTNNNKLVKYELEWSNLNDITNLNIDNFIIAFWRDSTQVDISLDGARIAQIKYLTKDNGYQANMYFNDSKVLDFDMNNTDVSQNIEISSGISPKNNVNLTLTNVLDKNTLEDYDKLENRLLLNWQLMGLNIMKFEIKNTANIFENTKLDIEINNVKKLEDLSEEDYIKIKNIFASFILEKEN